MDDDRTLMSRTSRGDMVAFEELVHRWQVKIRSFFLRCGTGSDAEDLTQQTFLRIYRYRDRYQPTAQVSTFLYLIARQVWIDHWRRATRHANLMCQCKTQAEIEITPTQNHVRPEKLDIAAALESLPESHRQVVERSFLFGQSHSEIALALGIPEGTVKSRLFNGLRKLKDFFNS